MPRQNLRALAGALALLALGCDTPCPSQPTTCATNATLRFVLPDGAPEAYDVRVVMKENGVEVEDRCLLMAPLPSDWPNGSMTASCTHNAISLYIRPVFDTDCDTNVVPGPEGVQVGSECETTVVHRELVLHRSGKPDEIQLQLSRSGESFTPLVATPTYAEQFPDGESCGARCVAADEKRAFDELTKTH
jgi:hypothetical protein